MRKVVIGAKYRHFKGHVYEVIGIARNSETLERLVIYKNVDSSDMWARPVWMFNSFVDKEQFPEVKQKYRFEKI